MRNIKRWISLAVVAVMLLGIGTWTLPAHADDITTASLLGKSNGGAAMAGDGLSSDSPLSEHSTPFISNIEAEVAHTISGSTLIHGFTYEQAADPAGTVQGGKDGYYCLTGASQLYTRADGIYSFVADITHYDNEGACVMFVRGVKNFTFGDGGYYGRDMNVIDVSIGNGGIYLLPVTDDDGNIWLRVNIKTVTGETVNENGADHYYATPDITYIPVNSTRITVADNGEELLILAGTEQVAKIGVSGTKDLSAYYPVAADACAETVTVTTLVDGAYRGSYGGPAAAEVTRGEDVDKGVARTVENAVVASSHLNGDLGFATRWTTLHLTEIRLMAYSDMHNTDIPDVEIQRNPYTVLWGNIGGGDAVFMHHPEITGGRFREIGVRFSAANAFSEVIVGAQGCEAITFRVYRWNSDYATTVKGVPVFEKTQAVGPAQNNIKLDEVLPAGEYLLVTSSTVEGAYLWSIQKKEEADVQHFIDGEIVSGAKDTLAGGIVYVDDTATAFGSLVEDVPTAHWATATTAANRETLTTANASYALQFAVAQSFRGIELALDGTGDLQLDLYPWNKNADETKAGTAVWSGSLSVAGEGTYVVPVASVQAGEYLLVLTCLSGEIELACVENPVAGVQVEVYSDSGTVDIVCGGLKFSDGVGAFADISFPEYEEESDTETADTDTAETDSAETGDAETNPADTDAPETVPVDTDSLDTDVVETDSTDTVANSDSVETDGGTEEGKGCKSSMIAGVTVLLLSVSSFLFLQKKKSKS